MFKSVFMWVYVDGGDLLGLKNMFFYKKGGGGLKSIGYVKMKPRMNSINIRISVVLNICIEGTCMYFEKKDTVHPPTPSF